MRGFAYAAKHSEAVQGQGTLDVMRYGRVLKAGGTVGVRGAGSAFDGVHYVDSVTQQPDARQLQAGLHPEAQRPAAHPST